MLRFRVDSDFRVKGDSPEPPGWLSRDETMDQVYQRNYFVPLGFFVVWYLCVLLVKQVARIIWIVRWRLRRSQWFARFQREARAVEGDAESRRATPQKWRGE